jgi:hypothetical protein
MAELLRLAYAMRTRAGASAPITAFGTVTRNVKLMTQSRTKHTNVLTFTFQSLLNA